MRKLIPHTFIVLLVLISSCCHVAKNQDASSLEYPLLLLTAAVKSKVCETNPPPDIPDSQLLSLSTQHDPSLLDPFKPYLVRTRHQGKNVTLLVCTKDGKKGLLEDASCTNYLDRELWKISPPVPCDFTVSPDVCK
jgi:hypothetical protein